MRKKIVSLALLSTIALANLTPVISQADEYDTQIQEKNNQISRIASEEAQAQAQVDQIQSQINENQSKSAELKAQNDALQKESNALSAEVDTLNNRINERSKTLENQARSAQVNSASASYVDILLNAESFSDAIHRIQAVSKMVSANNDLLVQQKNDKEAVVEKQKVNAEKIKTVWDNQQTLNEQAETLKTQEAQLKAAQIGLAATKANTEAERDNLLSKQAVAIAAAQKAAQEQAAAAAAQKAQLEAAAAVAAKVAQEQATQAQQQQEALQAQPQATTNDTGNSSKAEETKSMTELVPNPEPTTPPMNGGGNYSPVNISYPEGQCTWYVKVTFGARVGDYWGNGAQWAASAAADGKIVSATPAVGTVAVFPPGVGGAGGYGHVAVVIGVSGGNVTVQEANFNGLAPGSTRTLSAAGLSFIYV